MGIFLLKRTAEMVATVLIVATVTFALLRALPGGPFDDEMALSPEMKSVILQHYGLDLPVYQQYVRYLSNAVVGDFGRSYLYSEESISQIIKSTFPVSFQLGALSLLLSMFLGSILGLLAVAFNGRWPESVLMIAAGSGIAMPTFFLAPVLIWIFAIELRWLPPALWENPWHWVLPVGVLAIRPVSIIARLVRSSALDVVNTDFINAARARGAGEVRIYLKHVFKNSLIPVLGIVGQVAAGVLSGSFVIEVIFAIPGAGTHMVDGVLARDYPLVMAMVILYTVILSVMHWLADVGLHWADPRIGSRENN